MNFLTSGTAGLTTMGILRDLLTTELGPDAFYMSHLRATQIWKIKILKSLCNLGNISYKAVGTRSKSSLKMLLKVGQVPRNGLRGTPAFCHPSSIFKLMSSATFSKRFETLISVCRTRGIENNIFSIAQKIAFGEGYRWWCVKLQSCTGIKCLSS